jgi:hypothetical protein
VRRGFERRQAETKRTHAKNLHVGARDRAENPEATAHEIASPCPLAEVVVNGWVAPGFEEARGAITVRQLLGHEAGLAFVERLPVTKLSSRAAKATCRPRARG